MVESDNLLIILQLIGHKGSGQPTGTHTSANIETGSVVDTVTLFFLPSVWLHLIQFPRHWDWLCGTLLTWGENIRRLSLSHHNPSGFKLRTFDLDERRSVQFWCCSVQRTSPRNRRHHERLDEIECPNVRRRYESGLPRIGAAERLIFYGHWHYDSTAAACTDHWQDHDRQLVPGSNAKLVPNVHRAFRW